MTWRNLSVEWVPEQRLPLLQATVSKPLSPTPRFIQTRQFRPDREMQSSPGGAMDSMYHSTRMGCVCSSCHQITSMGIGICMRRYPPRTGVIISRMEYSTRHPQDFQQNTSLIHISEPTRRTPISYAVFCLKK